MKKISVLLLAGMVFMFLFTSCAKKEVETEPVEKPEVEKVEETTPKMEKPELTEEELFQRKSLEEINREGNLQKIHFDFDKYFIRDDMKPILHRNADWLLKHSTVEVLIEGHCDERGTIEYNMALGEKRAESAKNYLVSLGIPAEKLNIISYGKNRPAVKGVDEATHYQNRRAELLITKK
jgi:peptidoglycan-associated lipoprotein